MTCFGIWHQNCCIFTHSQVINLLHANLFIGWNTKFRFHGPSMTPLTDDAIKADYDATYMKRGAVLSQSQEMMCGQRPLNYNSKTGRRIHVECSLWEILASQTLKERKLLIWHVIIKQRPTFKIMVIQEPFGWLYMTQQFELSWLMRGSRSNGRRVIEHGGAFRR